MVLRHIRNALAWVFVAAFVLSGTVLVGQYFFSGNPKVAAPATGCAALVQTSMVACYQFDDASGQVLTDYSGNGHHGQLGTGAGVDSADPAWTTDGGEAVLLFDGVDDRVLGPSNLTPSSWTVIVVAKSNSLGAYRLAFAQPGSANGWGIGQNNATSWYYVHTSVAERPVGTISDSTWAFVAASRNGTAIKTYLNDGTPGSTTIASYNSNTNALRFGADVSSTFWSGPIAFGALYSGALSDADVAAIYSAIKVFKPGLGLP